MSKSIIASDIWFFYKYNIKNPTRLLCRGIYVPNFDL